MSNERKPLLSDEDVTILVANEEHRAIAQCGIDLARDWYENLIATGKLRVVKEVELKGNDYDCLLQCTGCNWGIGWHIEEELEPMKFCPGCGNPIKR